MERKSIRFEIGFADAELDSYTREADSLVVILVVWNAQRVRLKFDHVLMVVDRNLGEVSDFCQVVGESALLLESLGRYYEGAVPQGHPYRHYQLLNSDDYPALEVIAGSIDVERVRNVIGRRPMPEGALPVTGGTRSMAEIDPGAPSGRNLRVHLEQLVASSADLRILSEEESSALTRRIADAFVADERAVRWWDALKVPNYLMPYGDHRLGMLEDMVYNESRLLLAVTDDNPPPWTWIEGSPRGLLDLLGESPFFEYFLTDPAVSWVIFDTHHDKFVVAGS
jgi:hypothetical protein